MTSPQPLVVAGLCAVAALLVYAPLPFVAPSQLFAQGQSRPPGFSPRAPTTRPSARRSSSATPGAQALKVTVTLLPQADAIAAPTPARPSTSAPTSRLTVRLGTGLRPQRQRLGPGVRGARKRQRPRRRLSSSNAPCGVPGRRASRARTMPAASRRPACPSRGRWPRARAAPSKTFVLVANPNAMLMMVPATYLTGYRPVVSCRCRSLPPTRRVTFYPRGEHVAFLATARSSPHSCLSDER